MIELRFRVKDLRFGTVGFNLMQNNIILSYFWVFRFYRASFELCMNLGFSKVMEDDI